MKPHTIATFLLACSGATLACSPSSHGDAAALSAQWVRTRRSPRSSGRFGRWTTTAMQTASLLATRTKTRCHSK